MKNPRPKSSLSRTQAISKTQQILKNSQIKSPPKQQQLSTSQITNNLHFIPPKQYRINQQEVYNYVRNSVYETFKFKTSRNYQLVKQLTNITAPGRNQVIDRLCKKYSILRTNKKSCFENVQVNVEEITNRYVKSRSKQKQKQQIKARLKQEIAVNYRYGPKKQYRKSQQFFSFDGKQFKDLQRRYRQKERQNKINGIDNKNRSTQKKIHPYIKMYENAQMQALSKMGNNREFNLQMQCNSLPQSQDWQKSSNLVQKMLQKTKQQKRRVQSARPRATQKIFKPDFYLC